MTDFLSPSTHQPVVLTTREHTILALIAEGCPNHEIATTLLVSTDSVKTYNRRMFRKLGAINRENAVAKAFRAGLLR